MFKADPGKQRCHPGQN